MLLPGMDNDHSNLQYFQVTSEVWLLRPEAPELKATKWHVLQMPASKT